MYIEREHIVHFFEIMNKSALDYVLIKNIGGELPDYLEDGKDIDILVREEHKERFEQFMLAHNFEKLDAPLGRANGWNFAYQLPEYHFWKEKNIKYTLYVDASFKLSCKSLMPRMWIPLDSGINEDIWKNKYFDSDNGWWIMDRQTRFIYMIVRSIFDKQCFKDVYTKDIEKDIDMLQDEMVKSKLKLVFFKYTGRLVELIKQKRFEMIFDDYISFTEY